MSVETYNDFSWSTNNLGTFILSATRDGMQEQNIKHSLSDDPDDHTHEKKKLYFVAPKPTKSCSNYQCE